MNPECKDSPSPGVDFCVGVHFDSEATVWEAAWKEKFECLFVIWGHSELKGSEIRRSLLQLRNL